MKKLLSLFISGLATLLPVIISIYIFVGTLNFLDNLLAPVIQVSLGKDIPGLGFLLTTIIIILVGLISKNLLGKKLFSWWEKLFFKIPMLGKIYSTTKRITTSFFSSGRNSFKQVVLIEFPRPGLHSIGFITNDEFPYIEEDTYSVFVPTTPNPTSGFFVVVNKDQVKVLDISVERGIEILMSAGMINQ